MFWWPSYWSGVCPVSLNLDLLCDWMTSTVGWKWCFVTSEGRSQGEMELSPGSFAIVTFCSLNRDIRILKLPYCEETQDTWTWRNTDKPPSLCPAYFPIHRVHEHNKIVVLRPLSFRVAFNAAKYNWNGCWSLWLGIRPLNCLSQTEPDSVHLTGMRVMLKLPAGRRFSANHSFPPFQKALPVSLGLLFGEKGPSLPSQ